MLEVFMLALLFVAILIVVVEIFALIRWRSGWRLAAILPALVLCFVAARIVIDTRSDSTSHNLWPFEILLASGLGLAFLGALALGRTIARGRQRVA